MGLLLICFAVLALAAAGMGVGALAGRPPLRCCGDAGLLADVDAACPACTDPCAWRAERHREPTRLRPVAGGDPLDALP